MDSRTSCAIRRRSTSFSKSIVIKSFYKSGRKHSQAYTTSPVNPMADRSNVPSGPSSVGFIILNQDQAYPQQPSRVTFVVPDRNLDYYNTKLESYYSGSGEDEAVDDKAAKYINDMQKRFQSD